MNIKPTDPRIEAVRTMLTLSDEYMGALYPAESNHLESVDALIQPNVLFLGGYVGDELMACGAVKIMDDDGRYGEIKRVYVLDRCRGKGYSKQIMRVLEDHLREQAILYARLETGIKQPEALGLYEKLGYAYRAPFGKYNFDPLSVFMEKRLTAQP
jgi:putative acetyltransferase